MWRAQENESEKIKKTVALEVSSRFSEVSPEMKTSQHLSGTGCFVFFFSPFWKFTWNPPDGTRKYSLSRTGVVGAGNRSGYMRDQTKENKVAPDWVPMPSNFSLAKTGEGWRLLLSHARQVTLGHLQVLLVVTDVELSVCHSLGMNGLLSAQFFHVEFSFFFFLSSLIHT